MEDNGYIIKTFNDSVKFYLPRVEGYIEVIREMAATYGGMSLIEFDGYFQGRFEPVKYTRLEIHTNGVRQEDMIKKAEEIRLRLHQKSLALEFNNSLILIESK
jgi:hypothetical protein